MSDFTRRTATGADAGDMPYPLHELDRQRDEFRVERYIDPENPKLIAFRVIDAGGTVRGRIAFEWDAMEPDLPSRTIERVQRGASIHPKPDLRLVG